MRNKSRGQGVSLERDRKNLVLHCSPIEVVQVQKDVLAEKRAVRLRVVGVSNAN